MEAVHHERINKFLPSFSVESEIPLPWDRCKVDLRKRLQLSPLFPLPFPFEQFMLQTCYI